MGIFKMFYVCTYWFINKVYVVPLLFIIISYCKSCGNKDNKCK